MQATVEISMYPLAEDYAQAITEFILRVRRHAGVRAETNGLSTQLFGEYDHLMDILKDEMRTVLDERKVVFIMKLAAGERTRENLPTVLRA